MPQEGSAQYAPPLSTPPGTCSLDVLHGTILLGGVEGQWHVEIARAREWAARVWPPGADPEEEGDGLAIVPFVPPLSEGEPDLIQCMIAAAQEAFRRDREAGLRP